MPPQIISIRLSMPLNFGTVNCYLINTGSGFILIDTGSSNQRAVLESELVSAGCMPGDLKLVVITHGDFDHTGNAAYLRHKYGTKIAMHRGDLGMAVEGDMFSNRQSTNALVKFLAPLFVRFSKADRFEPDIYVDDGYDFSEFGLDARAISIPGHSLGSIGVLTGGGELFCGDLLSNVKQPELNSIMDDRKTAQLSVEKLNSYNVGNVYPGHGAPFVMQSFMNDY